MNSVSHHLLLYDGVCGLCNRFNNFVLEHDHKGQFVYASLQSDLAKEVLSKYGKDPSDLDTVYCVADYQKDTERLLSKSQVPLFIFEQLGQTWRALAFLKVLPGGLRDAAYDFIARHRYRTFGKFDVCPVPKTEWKDRFLA